MPAFETITVAIPTHWICALLYGDTDGLGQAEAASFWRWLADTTEDIGHGTQPTVGRIDAQSYVCRYHDAQPYGVAVCECYDVDLLVPVAQPASHMPIPETHSSGYYTARRGGSGSAAQGAR